MQYSDRHFEHIDPGALAPPANLYENARRICLALAVIGAIGVAIAWVMNPSQLYHSYLTSWTSVWSTLMGVMFLVMLLYMFDAGWSTVVRRPAEQMLVAMPVLLALAIPVVIGSFSGSLQHWVAMDPAEDHLLHVKQWYLNKPFMAVRFVVYAVLWLWLAYVLRRNSLRQDRDGASRWTISSRRWSAAGLVLGALTGSLCAFDLMMSLDHHWFSTVFAVYVLWGGIFSGTCVVALIAISLRRRLLHDYIGSDQLHDLGKLVFAFSVFWAYIAFSQYFLIWYANIPEETVYYLKRWRGITGEQDASWWIISLIMPALRFVIPFVVLMSANVKRNPRSLGVMCVILLFAHWLDHYWMIQPERTPAGPPLGYIWMDLSAMALIVGACAAVYFSYLRRSSLVPVMDPRLVEALSAEHVEEIEQADTE